MWLFLGVVVIALLACIVFVNVQASLYYVSAYAKATGRGFADVMRNPHGRTVYRTSRKLAAHGDRVTDRMLFDVALPRVDASSALVDVVLVSKRGLGVFCVQEGHGSVFGDAKDDFWVLVGSRKRDGSELLVPNLSEQVCAGAAALREYLLLDETAPIQVVPCVVFANRVDFDHVQMEGVCATHVRNVATRFEEVLGEPAIAAVPGEATEEGDVAAGSAGSAGSARAADSADHASTAASLCDDKARRMMYRALKACANSPAAGGEGDAQAEDVNPFDSPEPIAWMRSIAHRERIDATAAGLVRKADKLASSKEDFDALTWDRILEISREIDATTDRERTAELAAELRLIARTNVSLNYRFGIAQASEGTHLSPAGLTVETRVGEMSATRPDEQMHEALEDTGFFDDEKADGDVQGSLIGKTCLPDEDTELKQSEGETPSGQID